MLEGEEDVEFVFTISDSDEDGVPHMDAAVAEASDVEISKGKKRKRGRDEMPDREGAAKKKMKKKKGKSKNSGAQGSGKIDWETDEEKDVGARDAPEGGDDWAIDPEFEFPLEGAAGLDRGEMAEFDGWGFDGAKKGLAAGGEKRVVDIDEIIKRRKEKKGKGVESGTQGDDSSGVGEEEGVEAEEAEAGGVEAEAEGGENDDLPIQLDEEGDEFLAEDGFGMGVISDEEQSGAESENEGRGDVEDSDDENSVASPAPHPDDLASESSDEDKEDDPEEAARREAFFAPEDNTSAGVKDKGTLTFQSMSLSRPIHRGLAAVGFSLPTPIQAKTIPVALLGKDIVGGAVTGSGKTAAFIVPILERLHYRPRKIPTSRVAILVPTRELAIQCHAVATKLAGYTDIKFCLAVGGLSLKAQEAELRLRPDVIIATPGRFIDHMRNSASFTVDTLEILVLDEADRMLEDGFSEELNEILTTIPKSRQTMLFSATMTSSVDRLIRVGLNKPVRLMVDAQKQTVGTLVQEFVRLRPGREEKRMGYLLHLCTKIHTDRVIVFFRQKKEAHRARIIFGLTGLKAAELHGSMSQEQRITSVEAFRDNKVSFLLATDLASRGLDIKGVNTVLNYEAPQSHEIYLHRVGRTARAGRFGRACTLAAETDRKVVKATVKAGRAQGAKIVSRVVDTAEADAWAAKVDGMADEIEAVLVEEKEEKQLAQAEMQVRRGENLIVHEEDIKARPRRTWFATAAAKRTASHMGRAELNGDVAAAAAAEALAEKKGKLSNKDKKRLDDSAARREGKVWKKGRKEREGKGGLASSGKGKGKGKGKVGITKGKNNNRIKGGKPTRRSK